jgi:hypothetical protein
VNCKASPDVVTRGSESSVVAITAITRGPQNNTITYSWSANGGATISGSGSRVTLDTADLAPGKYTVTVTVNYGHDDITAVCSSTVSVVEKIIDCPTISSVIADPRTVEAGTNTRVTFHVSSSYPDDRSTTYWWSASSGSISGSGDTVTLDTTGLSAGTVRVKVTVSDGKCQGTDSATLTINSKATPPPLALISSICDTYKRLNDTKPDNTCKAFLDDDTARLQRDPRAVLVVQGYSQGKEKANIAQQRAERIRDYLVSKGIDSSRIKVQSKGNVPAPNALADNNKVVVIWLVPKGAIEPLEE